jgi:hypothetical protein
MTQQSKNPGYGNCRAMETGKNRVRFSSVPTALGKLDQERRVFHSYHSPYDWIHIKAKQ